MIRVKKLVPEKKYPPILTGVPQPPATTITSVEKVLEKYIEKKDIKREEIISINFTGDVCYLTYEKA